MPIRRFRPLSQRTSSKHSSKVDSQRGSSMIRSRANRTSTINSMKTKRWTTFGDLSGLSGSLEPGMEGCTRRRLHSCDSVDHKKDTRPAMYHCQNPYLPCNGSIYFPFSSAVRRSDCLHILLTLLCYCYFAALMEQVAIWPWCSLSLACPLR